MNLIVLYGPPAAGKLTVAKELAKLTGYKVFHNHLTLDLAEHIHSGLTPERANLTEKLRLLMFQEAANHNQNLIFTVVYQKGIDDSFFQETEQIVTASGGSVYFIQLIPSLEVLKERVTNPSRQAHSKLRDSTVLESFIAGYDYEASYTANNSLTIDNSKATADEVALSICKVFNIPIKQGADGLSKEDKPSAVNAS